MAKLSMYESSVPVLMRMLNNLCGILEKAAAHAEAKKIDPSVLIHARLYPDMFDLCRQVQIACDHAKGCGARLAGMEPPKYEDTETTFSQLIERVRKTSSFLNSLTADQFEGSEDRTVTLNMRGNTMNFNGTSYLLNMAMPNFYFHMTTAYDILRHCGVEVGKKDFAGSL